ncbi:hypothetical protein CUMW_260430, partial [Citrus unshiu]
KEAANDRAVAVPVVNSTLKIQSRLESLLIFEIMCTGLIIKSPIGLAILSELTKPIWRLFEKEVKERNKLTRQIITAGKKSFDN